MRKYPDEILREITLLLPDSANVSIANLAGVHPGWVSQVRNGKRSRKVLMAIAKYALEKGQRLEALGTSLEEEVGKLNIDPKL